MKTFISNKIILMDKNRSKAGIKKFLKKLLINNSLKSVFIIGFLINMTLSLNEVHANSCEIIKTLRIISQDHFKEQRGKNLDTKSYESLYKIPGSSECTINLLSDKWSDFSCYWYLFKGVNKKSEAQNTFESVVKSFQECIPGGGRPERIVHDKASETVWMEDIAPPKITHRIRINYYWRAPWWHMFIEYSHGDM